MNDPIFDFLERAKQLAVSPRDGGERAPIVAFMCAAIAIADELRAIRKAMEERR